jgi:hypothetical protein
MYFVFIYEKRRKKPIEIVLRMGERVRREKDRGRKISLKIYCKHICK